MLDTSVLEATFPITKAYARSLCGVRAPLLKRRRFGGVFDKNKPSKGSDEAEHTAVADPQAVPARQFDLDEVPNYMRRRWWPRIRDALYWQKQLLRRRGHCQCLFRRIASITQPCEDQIGIHRIAQRNLGNRNTRCSRLETDRPLSSSVQSRFVRRATPSRKYPYPSRTLSHTLKSQQGGQTGHLRNTFAD